MNIDMHIPTAYPTSRVKGPIHHRLETLRGGGNRNFADETSRLLLQLDPIEVLFSLMVHHTNQKDHSDVSKTMEREKLVCASTLP